MASKDDSNETPNVVTSNSVHKLRCVNRHCKYGDDLIRALEFVCVYYHVDYKPNKEVVK